MNEVYLKGYMSKEALAAGPGLKLLAKGRQGYRALGQGVGSAGSFLSKAPVIGKYIPQAAAGISRHPLRWGAGLAGAGAVGGSMFGRQQGGGWTQNQMLTAGGIGLGALLLGLMMSRR